MTDVALVINCFERTYRDVLAPGTFARVAGEACFQFSRRTALVNNVDDRRDAEELGRKLLQAGEVDEVVFVADRLDEALSRTGLRRADLGKVPYFTDWALVAVTLPGPNWMVHCDADLRMKQRADWITPSIELMERDPRVICANPCWPGDTWKREMIERDGDFALGQGFSDQVFLARRSELGQPIYCERSLASRRFPVAHLGHIFEARIDAHQRRQGRLRATYLPALWTHRSEMGVSYPRYSPRETASYLTNRAITRALRATPKRLRPRSLRWM
jgi:hypothetical protein